MSHLVTCQQPADLLFRDGLEIVDFLKLNLSELVWSGGVGVFEWDDEMGNLIPK